MSFRYLNHGGYFFFVSALNTKDRKGIAPAKINQNNAKMFLKPYPNPTRLKLATFIRVMKVQGQISIKISRVLFV